MRDVEAALSCYRPYLAVPCTFRRTRIRGRATGRPEPLDLHQSCRSRKADCSLKTTQLIQESCAVNLLDLVQFLVAHPLSTWAQVPPNSARKKGSSDSRGGCREPDEVGQGHREVHSGVSSEPNFPLQDEKKLGLRPQAVCQSRVLIKLHSDWNV
jgi:hypothetical protein